jgi:hypothetical protein
MRDFWYAECVPCKWITAHTTQDAAIRAAEDHVIELHRNVPSEVRGREYIGHVQNRTENAYATAQPSAPAEAAPSGSTLFEWTPAARKPA